MSSEHGHATSRREHAIPAVQSEKKSDELADANSAGGYETRVDPQLAAVIGNAAGELSVRIHSVFQSRGAASPPPPWRRRSVSVQRPRVDRVYLRCDPNRRR